MPTIKKVLKLELPMNAEFITINYITKWGQPMNYLVDVPVDELPDENICDKCDFNHWECVVDDDPDVCGGPHKIDINKYFDGDEKV